MEGSKLPWPCFIKLGHIIQYPIHCNLLPYYNTIKTGTMLNNSDIFKTLTLDQSIKAQEILALLKKSSTHHKFGKIWSNLAIKKIKIF